MLRTLEPILRDHAFFAGLDPAYLSLIAGCARNVVVPDGVFLFREGEPADKFFLIRDGRAVLEVAALASDMLAATRLQLLDVYGHANAG